MRAVVTALLTGGGASLLVGLLGLLGGCREADLGAVRADLESSAALVCAPPAARAPHGVRTREVQAAEIEAAIAKVCEADLAHVAMPAEPLAVIHEALVQERALVGHVRRSRMMIDAARVDLGKVKVPAGPVRTPEEALTRAAAMRCGPTWLGLDGAMLASAAAMTKAERAGEALDRCADVFALVRDEDLTGDITDVLLANSQLQRAVIACGPIVDGAPKEAAAKLASALASVRSSFPPSLDEARRRDRAEMVLFSFGKAREPSRTYACERANELAAGESNGGKPLTRTERNELERAWRSAQAQSEPADPKFDEAYAMSLALVDRLIARAKERAR